MDRPSTSCEEMSMCMDPSPSVQLTLRADPGSKELMECNGSVAFDVDVGKLRLKKLVLEPWFQDNTMLFDILLNDKKPFVMCIYPPGSGKSTMAELLEFYLSTNGMSEEIRKFLDKCQFQLVENERTKSNPSYKNFRASAAHVLFVDFSAIQGRTYGELEANYGAYMLHSWKASGLPDKMINDEKESLESGCVWTSFLRLRDSIHLFGKNVYVILDSVDNMYNLIANLRPEESKLLYTRFTEGIAGIIDQETGIIKTFCFGVSPYLIEEYRKYAITCHFIGSNDNVHEYFSYSDESIERIIGEWKLEISLCDCKKVAEFMYCDKNFVNPYLCVSYLRSLKENGASFTLNISPRSLWLKCIFSEDDLQLLYSVLLGEKSFQFNMNVSMYTMCVLPEDSERRYLYFPLFVYGGYLSCKEEKEDNTYTLSCANKSSEILLKHHLKILYYRKFRVQVSNNGSYCELFVKEYLAESFDSVCDKLSLMLTVLSSYCIRTKRTYHSFMSGVHSYLSCYGYEIAFDKEYGAIKPDAVIIGGKDKKLIIEEYKHVIPSEYNPKKARLAVQGVNESARCQTLKEFYAPLHSEETQKSDIVKRCRKAVSAARVQLGKYAPQFSSDYKKDVDVNILVFYLNHVILLHGKYFYDNCKFSKYEVFSSKGYFDDADLKSILNSE